MLIIIVRMGWEIFTFFSRPYLQTSKFARRALIKALNNRYNRLEELKEIKSPCLVMAGECDRHITAESSLETANALPNAKFYCYPQTAHLLPWEIPEIILNDIDKWLKLNILENGELK